MSGSTFKKLGYNKIEFQKSIFFSEKKKSQSGNIPWEMYTCMAYRSFSFVRIIDICYNNIKYWNKHG